MQDMPILVLPHLELSRAINAMISPMQGPLQKPACLSDSYARQ